MRTKYCRICEQDLPLDKEHFYTNGKTPAGSQKWKPTCKKCENSTRKDLAQEIIDKYFPVKECKICGYNKCKAALEFHHLVAEDKEYAISRYKYSGISIKSLELELQKCVLLCANCHREVHHGTTML